MRLRKRIQLHSYVIGIAPLIDVVFLLIIFFMVVSQFTQIEIEALELPPATQGERPADPLDKQIILNVHQDGRIRIASQDYTVDSFENLLLSRLQQFPSQDLNIVIRADRQTPWRLVRPLMEACARNAVNHIRVAVTEDTD
jgi:biopolymer transport protein ExbD